MWLEPPPQWFQSPLHRGTSLHPRGTSATIRSSSTPSFNALGIGHVSACPACPEIASVQDRAFNPLFIGACLRAAGRSSERSRKTSFNPLFIGAWVRAQYVFATQADAEAFQSPLHRGTSLH